MTVQAGTGYMLDLNFGSLVQPSKNVLQELF